MGHFLKSVVNSVNYIALFSLTGFVFLVTLTVLLSGCSHTPPILDHEGQVIPQSLTSLEELEINGIKQLLLIRGADRDLPVCLLVHGGLGTPYSALGHTFQRAWEKMFLVVQWDQRGSGKLYDRTDPGLITAEQLLEDTSAVSEYLVKRFGKPIYLMGHSWGSYLAFQTLARHPEFFKAYIGVGQTVGILKEDQYSHEWVLKEARRRKDLAALAAMEEIGQPPYADVSKAYDVKYGLVARYGGFLYGQQNMDFMFKALLSSSEYPFFDAIRYLIGMGNYKSALLSNSALNVWKLSLEDITEVSRPVYFLSGENDQATPASVLKEYFEKLQAPRKEMVLIKNAAHFLFIDQKEEFTRQLGRIISETES